MLVLVTHAPNLQGLGLHTKFSTALFSAQAQKWRILDVHSHCLRISRPRRVYRREANVTDVRVICATLARVILRPCESDAVYRTVLYMYGAGMSIPNMFIQPGPSGPPSHPCPVEISSQFRHIRIRRTLSSGFQVALYFTPDRPLVLRCDRRISCGLRK